MGGEDNAGKRIGEKTGSSVRLNVCHRENEIPKRRTSRRVDDEEDVSMAAKKKAPAKKAAGKKAAGKKSVKKAGSKEKPPAKKVPTKKTGAKKAATKSSVKAKVGTRARGVEKTRSKKLAMRAEAFGALAVAVRICRDGSAANGFKAALETAGGEFESVVWSEESRCSDPLRRRPGTYECRWLVRGNAGDTYRLRAEPQPQVTGGFTMKTLTSTTNQGSFNVRVSGGVP